MPPRRGVDFSTRISRKFCGVSFCNVSAFDGQPPAPKKGKGKGQAKGAGKGVGKGVGRDAAKTKGQAEVPKSPRRSSIVPRRSRKESSSAGSSRCHGQCRRSGGSVAFGWEYGRPNRQCLQVQSENVSIVCAQFIGRAEKRLCKADKALEKLQTDRGIFVRELAEGRPRMEALRAEASKDMAAQPQPEGDPPGTEEVRRLRELVEILRNRVSSLEVGKEDHWRDVEELWELRREVEQLMQLRDEHPAGAPSIQSRSDKMSNLIEEADGKRRRVLAITEGGGTMPDSM